jgi:hypothetical protein
MLFKKLNELFDALEVKFPYSTMSSAFKGSHHLIKKDGMLILNVWVNGRLWQEGIEEHDLDDIPKLIDTINHMIETWPK